MCAIPFMTSRAEEAVENLRRTGHRIEFVTDARSQPMYEHPPVLSGDAQDLFGAYVGDSLIYFDHHVPDAWIIPRVLMEQLEPKDAPYRIPCEELKVTLYEDLIRDILEKQNRCIPHNLSFAACRATLEAQAKLEE